MKMIDVLTKLANGEIEDKSTLLVESEVGETFEYVYYERYCFFRGQCCSTLEDDFGIDKDFLNYEVELIPPKEKKYRVRFKLLGSSREDSFLSWEKCPYGVFLSIQEGTGDIKTHFTKSELQSIQPIREFLEDMKDKYELIEVEDNEVD